MDEHELRELAKELRRELASVVDDEAERRRTAAELDGALALPPGQAKQALLQVMRTREQTRTWVQARLGAGADRDRGIPGLLGVPTAPLGVHVVCPNGDYDRFLESPDEDPGRCPIDGLKLVPAGE